MKPTLFPIALLLTLAGCGDAGQSSAPATNATTEDPRAAVAFPEATAAGTFADSLATLPLATAGDNTAGQNYAKAVGGWYASDLTSGIKAHPLAAGVWTNYRAVLRMVAKSRGLKKATPQDAKNWDGLASECEAVAATLVPLTQDKPAPTSDKALPVLQLAWDGMQHVRLGAERYMMYLEHPETRNR
jgi:hypothetical protein